MKASLLILSSCLGVLAAGCASTRPAVSLDLPVASRYVFRGAVLDDNAVFQPAVRVEHEVGGGKLGAGLWSSVELGDDRGYEGELTEYDSTLDYSMTLGRVDLTLGVSRYEYPHTGAPGSTEVFAQAAINELPLTPTLEAWYDCDEVHGVYVNFNLSHQFELATDWSVSTVAGVGWMDDAQANSFFGVERSGLSDALLQATVEHPFSEHVTFSGVLALSRVLESDYRDAVSKPDNAWVALGLSIGF